MKTRVKICNGTREMVPWLKENVGPEVDDYPLADLICERWRGHGWSLTLGENRQWVDVEINDEKLATMFLLRWA